MASYVREAGAGDAPWVGSVVCGRNCAEMCGAYSNGMGFFLPGGDRN